MKNFHKYFICLLIGAQAQICFNAKKRELTLFECGIFSKTEHPGVSFDFRYTTPKGVVLKGSVMLKPTDTLVLARGQFLGNYRPNEEELRGMVIAYDECHRSKGEERPRPDAKRLRRNSW